MTTTMNIHGVGDYFRVEAKATKAKNSAWVTFVFRHTGSGVLSNEYTVFVPSLTIANRIAGAINREIAAIEAEAKAAGEFLAAAE